MKKCIRVSKHKVQLQSIMLLSLGFACLIIIGSSHAIPKESEKRVLDNDLSHSEHYEDGHHNAKYDHEAFLGEDQAKTFDQLTPEESSRRLGIIYDKIDTNNDKQVDLAELKNWIQFTQRRYIQDDVERQWKTHNPSGNDTIEWEVYKGTVYGFLDDLDEKEKDKEDGMGFSYRKMLSRDRRRWAVADRDGDEKLTKEEFTDFLHPEESPYMRDIVVAETIEDIDKNGDGKVSIEEYIGDMYPNKEDDDEDEPDWVKSERDIFMNFRDKDKDGLMDTEEVKEWIIPTDFDHAEAEARHLIYEADADSDEKLTKEEVLEKYDLFVGSQATDFGDVLVRHDEF
ncbi:calumenin-B isoform X1 [Culicoides brevitarsis]|uniref:calumenin-B isoform X1 n=2 Tax=Culicoides brevitarsis TaxID=469753 RepID=UPI00307C9366